MSATVRGLRAVGIDARGIAVYGHSPVRDDTGVTRLSDAESRRSPRWFRDVVPRLRELLAEIREADVLHWYMTPGLPGGLDLRYAAALGKPSLVEFAGGDIRNPKIESADNRYYAAARPQYEYRAWETEENSARTQRIFASAGCEAIVSCPSLLDYLEPGRFTHVHMVRQRVIVTDFEPRYPDPANTRPLVVHASTAPVAKGSAAVAEAAERLRGRVDFELVMLDRVPREDALRTIARADVYLDQFVIGAHGSAAIEAMALGKPVVGYIKPSVQARYPADIPLINASLEELPHILESLLRDGARRHEIGRLGRAYAERTHDATKLAGALREVYTGAIRRKAGAAASASR